MAKIKKKGTSGQAKNFITRTQAVRKLQISLPDFRRLCIFKGIYPRQPRNRQKAAKNSTPSTTFYYTKDIQYLLHEPLLNKFREHNALAKKIAKALGKGRDKDATRLEQTQAPRMTLDHIVKERYPTFHDALRDLDDALSMLFLFANLPSHIHYSPKTIRLCQRLCHEFQHYLIISHSLRKSFLSIKGIYYQASIQGQDILWLVPYNFVQRVTGDVDFRIMATFVEFYTTLLGFVNYRLYTTAGLMYPPKFNASSDEQGGALTAFLPQVHQVNGGGSEVTQTSKHESRVDKSANKRAQAVADSVLQKQQDTPEDNDTTAEAPSDLEEDSRNDKDDDAGDQSAFRPQAPDADIIDLPNLSSSEMSQKAGDLFKPFVFFLSRETPRTPLEFLLKAFGCSRIGWNETSGAGAFTHDEKDQRITHEVVDRPPQPVSNGVAEEDQDGASLQTKGRMPGRTYIQPQWVWDCVNACELLRPDLYAPGATLPPHLSPFVKPKPGEYDPSKPLEGAEDEEEDAAAREGDEKQAQEDEEELELDEHEASFAGLSDEDQEGKDESIVDGVDSIKDLADLSAPAGAGRDQDTDEPSHIEAKDDFGGFSDSDGGSDDYERELKAETTGRAALTPQAKTQQEKKRKQRADEEWKKDRQKMMMSRKKRALYERMEYSKGQKDAVDDKLRAKRRKIERATA